MKPAAIIGNTDDDFALPALDPERVAALLDPFVVDRMRLDSRAWQARIGRQEEKWRGRLRRRRLFGWLPSTGRLPRILRGRRTQQYVRDSYEETWTRRQWPDPDEATMPDRSNINVEWRGEGLVVRPGGVPRVHLDAMAEAIARLRPRSVLEVGAGDGLNLFTLASRFPDIEWTGIELTEAGVARAREVQQLDEFPAALERYLPWQNADPEAFRRIRFLQGDATALPFGDGGFDMVCSRQALEQMESVRAAAFSEIARVARRDVLCGEPFADFNRSALQRNYVAAKDYFSLPSDGLRDFGIEPVGVCGDFPQNVLLGVGVVLGRVGRATR